MEIGSVLRCCASITMRGENVGWGASGQLGAHSDFSGRLGRQSQVRAGGSDWWGCSPSPRLFLEAQENPQGTLSPQESPMSSAGLCWGLWEKPNPRDGLQGSPRVRLAASDPGRPAAAPETPSRCWKAARCAGSRVANTPHPHSRGRVPGTRPGRCAPQARGKSYLRAGNINGVSSLSHFRTPGNPSAFLPP